MTPSHRILTLLATVGLAACAADAPSAPADAHASRGQAHAAPTAGVNRQLAELRQATARFHDFDRAVEAGYAQITPCWEHRTQGAMGYHYGREWPWDTDASLLEPELLIYEPGPGGQMRLVGMEYVVPKAAWDSISPGAPPSLLGQEFHPHSSLPIYKLHLWLWRDNPRGTFADWNPKVSCAHAAQTDYFE
ncbi:MAG TPA: hypothetical protein VHG51_06860 [Longimicrobiaceae bacterium]|nr:hypothetical protein [Longimicrobiaceae bacterium]